MGVEELRAALEQEGRARVAALLREAESEAAQLREEAARDAERGRAERLAREEASVRRDARARVSAARAAARRRVLEAREEFLARVFERAEDELSRALEAPDAQSWLLDRAREALAHLPEGAARLVASIGAAPALADAFGAREDVHVEDDPELPGGFRAIGAGGAIVVDATAPALIGQARATLSIDVLKRLERGRATTRGDGGA